MKKQLLGTCVILLVSLMLVGCGDKSGKAKSKDTIKIGISVYNQYDTFISEMMNSVNEYVSELEEMYGVTVFLEVQNANSNQMTQNDQMDYFIDRDFDVVCINLVDRTDASTIIERGKNADIPIIFFNRELVEEDLERWDKLYYVGAEAFESGIMQGEILVQSAQEDFSAIDRNGDGVLQYVMLEGEAGHQDSIVRSMYAIQTVTEAGIKVEKLADEIANWNRDQGKTKMLQWIVEYGETIEVVFANNDDMALGARDALAEKGYYTGEGVAPIILGIDGTKAGIKAVEDGEFLGTVLNDSAGQARGMMELAYSVATGNELSAEFDLLNDRYIRLPYRKIFENSNVNANSVENF